MVYCKDMFDASKEGLQATTRDGLRAIAKDLNIAGRGHMTKAQLVDAIYEAVHNNEDSSVDESAPKVQEKTEYIKTAEKGTIMAFRLPDGKVKSAKMIERSLKREKLKMETAYGRQFIISFSDVIWVKTGKRWPKGVFNLLKGNMDNEEGKQNQ